MGLLAAEMLARTGKDPGEIYAGLTEQFGAPLYERIDADQPRIGRIVVEGDQRRRLLFVHGQPGADRFFLVIRPLLEPLAGDIVDARYSRRRVALVIHATGGDVRPAADQTIDLSRTVSAEFAGGGEKSLQVTFDKRNTAMHLAWQ